MSNWYEERRFGIIKVTGHLQRESPDDLQQCFTCCRFLPTDIRHDFARDQSEYQGMCPEFVPVPEGMKIPEYQLLVHVQENQTGDRSMTVRVIRVSDRIFGPVEKEEPLEPDTAQMVEIRKVG